MSRRTPIAAALLAVLLAPPALADDAKATADSDAAPTQVSGVVVTGQAAPGNAIDKLPENLHDVEPVADGREQGADAVGRGDLARRRPAPGARRHHRRRRGRPDRQQHQPERLHRPDRHLPRRLPRPGPVLPGHLRPAGGRGADGPLLHAVRARLDRGRDRPGVQDAHAQAVHRDGGLRHDQRPGAGRPSTRTSRCRPPPRRASP